MVILKFDNEEEKELDRILSILANEFHMEPMQDATQAILQFPGLEIRLHQRRVLRDGTDVPLTRLEYGILTYLASYPGIVFSREQIFEKVWHMDSDSCFHVITSSISRLREKIEPDRQNPTYIHTVYGGYKFEPKNAEK